MTMALGKVSRNSVLSDDDTFDTLIQGADLESPESSNSGDEEEPCRNDNPETPTKPLSMEEENKLLRAELADLRSELAYWKSKANETGDDALASTPTKERETGLWENTINGLKQFVSTPTEERRSLNSMSLDSPSGGSIEFSTRADTGLHHRKGPAPTSSSYFEKLTISPFKFFEEEPSIPDHEANTLSANEEGVSLVKSHASDRGCDREEASSIDSGEEEVEPSFYHSLVDRGAWLVGLLVLQSFSSFIIQHNERLLQRHTVIVRFLTMLVGAGGNAGNQASVRVIRGLATGKVDDANIKPYLKTELQAGFFLSAVLGVAGCVRAAVFLTPVAETFAITASLIIIVASSIFLGTILPLLMKKVKIDPAHSSTTIQVLMDILGVAITVYISSLLLDHAVGRDPSN